jgi:hypothetical protein
MVISIIAYWSSVAGGRDGGARVEVGTRIGLVREGRLRRMIAAAHHCRGARNLYLEEIAPH